MSRNTSKSQDRSKRKSKSEDKNSTMIDRHTVSTHSSSDSTGI